MKILQPNKNNNKKDFIKISLKGSNSFHWSVEENKSKTTTKEPNPQTT